MGSGQIKMDREATLDTAKKIENVGGLIADAKSKADNLDAYFTSWQGEAAKSGKKTIEMLHKTLGSLQSMDGNITSALIRTAENFTGADEKMAAEIKADWSEE